MDPAALVAAATRVLGIALPDGSRRNLNEANTRAFVIDPIIGALGYAGPDQIELEVAVGRSGQSLDYVITAHGIRIAVEAKSLQTTLADREASQLVGYIAQEGIRWAILTNGLDWHIFDNRVDGDWKQKRVATLDLEAAHRAGGLEDALHPLALLAREALATGDAELSAWSRDARARACLRDLLSDPSSPLIRAAVDAIGMRGVSLEPAAVAAMLRVRAAAPVAPAPPPRPAVAVPAAPGAAAPSQPAPADGVNFFLFPSWNSQGVTSLDYLNAWLPTGAWFIGSTVKNRLAPKAGDQCCLYASYQGLVATAEIAGSADREVPEEEWPGPSAWGRGWFRLPLRNIQRLPEPRKISKDLRRQLDALQPEQPGKRRRPLVSRSVLPLTERDFRLLTGQG